MISKKQAEILKELLLFDEIRLKRGGYFFESSGDKVDLRSLRGLIIRKLLRPSAYNQASSIGHIRSPIFYDDSVTDNGIEELSKYAKTLGYFKREDILKMIKKYMLEERGIKQNG